MEGLIEVHTENVTLDELLDSGIGEQVEAAMLSYDDEFHFATSRSTYIPKGDLLTNDPESAEIVDWGNTQEGDDLGPLILKSTGELVGLRYSNRSEDDTGSFSYTGECDDEAGDTQSYVADVTIAFDIIS